jgi:hypothetical protein
LIWRMTALVLAILAFLAPAATARAAEAPCELELRSKCFGVESIEASLSTTKAGAHPNLTFTFDVKKDPESEPNVFGLKNAYAPTRNVRFELPPGLIGDPNVLGGSQQCTIAEFTSSVCPNASQVGVTRIYAYSLTRTFTESVYMMQSPGSDVVARLAFVAGAYPAFVDLRVRSESDYGLTAEISDAPAVASLLRAETTTWGVPADPSHDTERCTPAEAFLGCVVSIERPPGSRRLPFLTNPTRCGVPLEMRVAASSWAEPQRFDTVSTPFPPVSGCDDLPFGPSLEVEPTSHHTLVPSGLDLTIKLPASEGANVLEPSQMRRIRIDFPPGLAINTGSSDGLATCSDAQVRFEENAASKCPDPAKLASTEFDIPVLDRNLRGAIYLREPEPGHPFRIWIVADDLGLHVKLPGELEVDKQTGQIHSIVLGVPRLEGLPQAPLREVKLDLKSGFRAPLLTPAGCGTYYTHYDFTPWSGGPDVIGDTPMQITEGCDGGGFSPKLSAGSLDSRGGAFSPFEFTITREDSEQNISGLGVTLPHGMTASFAGILHCEGTAAETGDCPADSRVGRVVAGVGAGPAPLWVPQPGKRPTAVYLGGPYKGAPLSIVAVVPKQAGPFDFGDEVIRSAVYVNPDTARATAETDPLPQVVPDIGIPLFYRTIFVELDRSDFTLNPTSCAQKQTEATLTSPIGAVAHTSSTFAAVNCAKLGFKPRLALRLSGAIHRGGAPGLRAVLNMPKAGANIASTWVTLPPSELVENEHFNNVCTRVDFAAHRCPAGSIYGHAMAISPLFDFPLEGPVYLRSNPQSRNGLPELVAALKGPVSMPIEIDVEGEIDSVKDRLRTRFETVPDAPVTKFTLAMKGGSKSLLANTENLCARAHHATASFKAQNGRKVTLHPKVAVSCHGGQPKKGK